MDNCVLDRGHLQGCTTLIDVCQSSVTSCHIRCTHRLKLYIPEDGRDIWPKQVGTVYNKHKHFAASW